MSQIELVLEQLKLLPEAKVQRVVDFVRGLQEDQRIDRQRALAETAGSMTPEEADEFQRTIDDHCERIDPNDAERFD
jgi:hypothetical protein